MKEVRGNLITMAQNGDFDIIVHGCNCFHTMGGGIALQICKTWPQVYGVDCTTIYGDRKKLGTISSIDISNDNSLLTVVNAYTQFRFGRGKQVSYEAIRDCFRKIKKSYHDRKIGIPMIGAGLAGGDWDIISDIIEKEMTGEDITLVLYG